MLPYSPYDITQHTPRPYYVSQGPCITSDANTELDGTRHTFNYSRCQTCPPPCTQTRDPEPRKNPPKGFRPDQTLSSMEPSRSNATPVCQAAPLRLRLSCTKGARACCQLQLSMSSPPHLPGSGPPPLPELRWGPFVGSLVL